MSLSNTYLYFYWILSLRHLNPIQRSTENNKDGPGKRSDLRCCYLCFFLDFCAHLCGGWVGCLAGGRRGSSHSQPLLVNCKCSTPNTIKVMKLTYDRQHIVECVYIAAQDNKTTWNKLIFTKGLQAEDFPLKKMCFFIWGSHLDLRNQGDFKRCRLSWLTNSVLAYEPNCGGGELRGLSPWVCTAVHMEPKFVNLEIWLHNLTYFGNETFRHGIWIFNFLSNLSAF